MATKVLLLGGTGVLSRDVMLLAVKHGYEVFILNRGKRQLFLPPEVHVLKANVKNPEEVRELVKDMAFDVVVDFLSYVPKDIQRSLEIFAGKCRQFIFISSACAYRRAKGDGIITEDSPLINPAWDYSVNKVECERLLIKKCKEADIDYTIVRPYITYGDTRIPYGIMPSYGLHWSLAGRILSGKPVLMWDDGEALCTITHTSDFAKGVVGLLGNPQAYNEAFHVVGDEVCSWKEMIHIIGDILNKKPDTVAIPASYIADKLPEYRGMLLGDWALDAVFDNSKIKRVVPEFVCTTSLREGIERTLQHYRTNDYLGGIDYQWDAQMDRLIAGYLKGSEREKRKLKFVDYLGRATGKEKRIYSRYRYMPFPLIESFEFAERVWNRFSKIGR